ncbi:MAG: hypothetical protein AB1467_05695 [Candidatus Diapherotrites archaeon]
MADIYPHTGKQRQHEKPHETATREVAEEIGFKVPGKIKQFPWFKVQSAAKEIGIAKRKFSFYGAKFKTVPKEKAPALAIVRDVVNGTIEPLYAIDIKTKEPDKLLKEKFSELPNGMLRVKEAEDAWEMKYAAKIPRNSRSIKEFIEKNKKSLTQTALICLSIYAEELEKTGK